MKFSDEQLDFLAEQDEILVELPENTSKSKLWRHYHLDLGNVSGDGEDEYDLFYNSDLRSWCGFLEDPYDYSFLRLRPTWYAQEWRSDRFEQRKWIKGHGQFTKTGLVYIKGHYRTTITKSWFSALMDDAVQVILNPDFKNQTKIMTPSDLKVPVNFKPQHQ